MPRSILFLPHSTTSQSPLSRVQGLGIGLVADGVLRLWIVVFVADIIYLFSGGVGIFLCGLILTAEVESEDGHWLY